MSGKYGYKKCTDGVNLKPRVSGLLLILFVLGSLWLIFEFAEKERSRDLMSWQSRLAMLAEIRQADVQDWIENRKLQLQNLSSNSSLSLFLSLSSDNKENRSSPVFLAQQAHVRNLLRVSAERFGFSSSLNHFNQVNGRGVTGYGLAILDVHKNLLMATRGFTKDIEKHRYHIDKVYKTAKTGVIDLHSGYNQQPVYGYISPVFHIQDNKKKTPVGAVIVLLDPQIKLYSILQNRQSITRTDETLLVKRNAASLEYISPVRGGFKLFHKLPDNNNQLASSFAYHNPGGFSIMKDYQGERVLVTGRELKNSDWHLVQKISAVEAFADFNEHYKFLITTFTLLVLLISFAFIAIWRHSTSVRLQALSLSLQAHVALLDAVADNIQENILLLDENARIMFINPVFASSMKLKFNELQGLHLVSVLGKDMADILIACQRSENHPENCPDNQDSVIPLSTGGEKRIYHVSITRLESGEFKNAQLYVMHDISDIKWEQERREKLSKSIISTLVKAVDLHDPFCARHSERTREVAMEIGKAMSLSAEQLESLEMASLLANIGKLFVAKDILTKMQNLTESEMEQLKKHTQYSVEILSGLAFNGPVIDIISQKNEQLDGKGYPAGLSGEDILPESRILSVANAFVAMVSSRAYREGRGVNEVMDLLLEQSGAHYDRHVIAALFHLAQNRTSWGSWRDISKDLSGQARSGYL